MFKRNTDVLVWWKEQAARVERNAGQDWAVPRMTSVRRFAAVGVCLSR